MRQGLAKFDGMMPWRDYRSSIPIDRLLEWAYRQQRADLVIGMGAGLQRIEAAVDGVEIGSVSACGCAAVARIAELGCQVDAHGGPAGHLHVDAERVHMAVLRLQAPVQRLVIEAAKAGAPPDWLPGAQPEAMPRVNGRGQVRIFHADWDKARNYGWCPIDWTISLARIEAARMAYGLWWNALWRLRLDLAGTVLTDHRPMGAAAPERPWEVVRFAA